MRATPSRRTRLAAITPTERIAVGLIAAAATVGALLAKPTPEPTSNVVGNVLATTVFAVTLTFAASLARTWTWIVVASGAAAASAAAQQAMSQSLLPAVALEAAALGTAAHDITRHRRVIGALLGAASVQFLLRLGAGPFLGSTALLAAALSAPMLVTGWQRARGPVRANLRRVAFAVGTVAAGSILLSAFSLLQARAATNQAVAHLRAGLNAARQGDTQNASKELAAAAQSFDTARSDAGSLWTLPTRLIPLVAQQTESVSRLTGAGAKAAAAAAKATAEADVESLRMRGGRIDIAKIEATKRPLAEIRAALGRLQVAVRESRSPWLLSPLAGRVDSVSAQLDRAAREVDVASQAVAVAPALLGGSGTRHYFVAFANPAETRDLGGFVGGYGELVVDNGKLTLDRVGRASDLNAGGPFNLPNVDALPPRYRAFNLERFWQNITASPDFPTVAEAVHQLWAASVGTPLDGVLYVDPYSLSALLRLTGPIDAPALGRRIDADNVVPFLLRDQYTDLNIADERHDLLSVTAKTVFDKLTASDLPGPSVIANTLGPPARAGHLYLHSFRPDEQSLFAALGVDGAIPQVKGDLLMVTASNRGANKIDAFLDRSIEDRVQVDPATGRVDATVRITLRNGAPAAGLPDYLIGNDIGLPKGTNALIVSISTPLELDSATVDGAPVRNLSYREYGYYTHSASVVLPPGATQVLELRLHGQVPPGQSYTLTVIPRANSADTGPEPLRVTVTASRGWQVSRAEGLQKKGGEADVSEGLVGRLEFRVRFAQS